MLMRREEAGRAVTVGADKAYDTADFVATCKAFAVEAHVARNTAGRRSNIADAVAGSAPYRASQVHRKRIEEVFGWVKTVGAPLEDPPSWSGAGRLAVHPGAGGLRSGPPAEADGGRSVNPGNRPLRGAVDHESPILGKALGYSRPRWCQNRPSRRSDIFDTSIGLTTQSIR